MADLRSRAERLRYWISHPRFAFGAASVKVYFFAHPGYPRIARDCIGHLEKAVSPSWECFEWGSGHSTIFFAKRTKHVVSIEPDKSWYDRVVEWARAAKLTNLDLRHVPVSDPSEPRSKESVAYSDSILAFPDESFDCIFVDGVLRNECMANAPRKLKPGGIAILDDSQRGYDTSPFGNWPQKTFTDFNKNTTIWTKPRNDKEEA